MIQLNGYKVCIWCSVERNGEFKHNSRRDVIVHAPNKELAKQMVALKPAREHPDIGMKVGEEWIHSVGYLGRVKHVVRVEYVKDD